MISRYVRREFLEILWLVVYVVLGIGIFTLFFGLGPSAGFDKDIILQKNLFYIGYGAVFIIGIVALKLIGLMIFKEKDSDIDGPIVHDSKQGIFNNFKIVRNPFLLWFFSVIIFSVLGWLAARNQTFFNAIPNYEQQFTPSADLFFSVFPASIVETLGAIFLISLVGFFLGLMVLKGKLNKKWFLVLFIPLGSLASMIFGIINHISRYGGSEIAMTSVAIFWLVGGLLTTISGSMIPFVVLHDVNNFFFKFSTLFSSDIVTFTTFTVIGILTITFLLFAFKIRGKKKSET